MTQMQNLIKNNRDVFLKFHNNKKITNDERKKIVNFFQEVAYQVGLRQLWFSKLKRLNK